MDNVQEIKFDNVEKIPNEDIPIEIKIRTRIQELEHLKGQTIEQLKIQQTLAIRPIEVAIEELKALLINK